MMRWMRLGTTLIDAIIRSIGLLGKHVQFPLPRGGGHPSSLVLKDHFTFLRRLPIPFANQGRACP